MKSFLLLVGGGALLLGLVGISLVARNGDTPWNIYLLFGGIGALFVAKFGLIGWFILAAARFCAAVVTTVEVAKEARD